MEGGEVEGRNSATKAPTHLPTHNGTLRQRKYMEDTKSETRASFLIYLSKRRQQYSRKCVCWCWCVGMCVCTRAHVSVRLWEHKRHVAERNKLTPQPTRLHSPQ